MWLGVPFVSLSSLKSMIFSMEDFISSVSAGLFLKTMLFEFKSAWIMFFFGEIKWKNYKLVLVKLKKKYVFLPWNEPLSLLELFARSIPHTVYKA